MRTLEKNNKLYRILWLCGGLLLVLAGVLVAFNPGGALRAVSVFLALMLIGNGLAELAVYSCLRGIFCGLGGTLLNAIITLLLGLLVLFNRWITVVTVPVLFSVWILFIGVTTFLRGLELHQFQIRGWLAFMALGILQVLLGLAAIFQPMTAMTLVGLLVGGQLVLRGVDAILSALFFNSFYL